MNKFTQKKQLLALLSIFIITMAPSVNAEQQATSAPQEHAQTPAHIVTKEQNEFFEEVIKRISYYVIQLEKQVQHFLSKQDKNPYNKHVDGFHKTLEDMKKDIIAPVEQALKMENSSPFYTALLQETNTVVHGLYETLESLYTMLHKNRGNKQLQKIAGEFKMLQASLKSKLNALLPRIQKLQQATVPFNPALAHKIGEFAVDLTKLLTSKTNPMELLSQINHRISCRA